MHGLLSVHTFAVPAPQIPPLHWSPVVHWLPSLHKFALGVWLHVPLVLSQTSSVHVFWSLQFTFCAPLQTPWKHKSICVHALPSSQVEKLPFAAVTQAPALQLLTRHALVLTGQSPLVVHVLLQPWMTVCVQLPLAPSQASRVQGSLSAQFFWVLLVQTPSAHASLTVHALPSEQAPLLRLACTQAPLSGSQVSLVHALLSLQSVSWPP